MVYIIQFKLFIISQCVFLQKKDSSANSLFGKCRELCQGNGKKFLKLVCFKVSYHGGHLEINSYSSQRVSEVRYTPTPISHWLRAALQRFWFPGISNQLQSGAEQPSAVSEKAWSRDTYTGNGESSGQSEIIMPEDNAKH